MVRLIHIDRSGKSEGDWVINSLKDIINYIKSKEESYKYKEIENRTRNVSIL